MVYGVCRAMLRDVHEAEDATQQVFLAAYQALLGGAAVRDPARWLGTIARNECRARIATGMRRPLSVAEEDLDLLPAVSDEHLRRSQAEELRAALARLPERQRHAVVLRYLYGLRYAEVATALGLSLPATEALLFRARRALRLRLRPVVGAAVAVPSVLREELALALPGFGGSARAGAAAAGVTGGLLTKLTAGSVGVKIATSATAISAVGVVGAVPSERAPRADEGTAVVVARSPTGDPQAFAKEDRHDENRGNGSSHGPGTAGGRPEGGSEGRSGSGHSEGTTDGRSGSSGSRSGAGGGEPMHHDTSIEESRGSSGPSESSGSLGSSNGTDESSSGERSGSSGEGSGSSDERSGSSGPSD